MARAMAITMPCSTPSTMTPRLAMTERASALLRTRQYLTSTRTSNSERAAPMSTAARADWGRSASRELKNRSKTATIPAPTTDASWDLAPACSTTAVREPLVDTAKPCKRPEARLAAPIPIISWFGSTSSPRRAPKLAEVAMVSARETSVMPTAAIMSGPMSENLVHGKRWLGSPLGSDPTVGTPWA